MSVGKWLLSVLLVAVCGAFAVAQNHPKTVVVTINYTDDGDILVQPKTFHAQVGDTVLFRTDSGGELILRFVNPFSNDGWVVRSTGGVLSLVAQNGGDYQYRCSIQYPDGRIVGWEAGDRDSYNGGNGSVRP